MELKGRKLVAHLRGLGAVGASSLIASLAPDARAQSWSWNSVGGMSCYRYQHASAFDCSRGKVVVFGGYSNCWCGNMSDTQEWNGSSWISTPLNSGSPSARREHAMAYDDSRSRIVMFGGLTSSGTPTDEVWELAGPNWTQITPSGTQPTARYRHAMCYDINRNTMLMFGGLDNAGNQGDLWAWDGLAWTQIAQGTLAPSARSLHALTYDTNSSRVLLFGGATNASSYSDELWHWDGSAWTQTPASGTWPSGRSGHGMTYDRSQRVAILQGGQASQGYMQDAWTYNGTAWTQISGVLNSYQSPLVYDAARNKSLVHIGYSPYHGCQNATYELSGAPQQAAPTVGYSSISTSGTPRYPYLHATSALPQGGLLMFGGMSYSAPLPVLTYEHQNGNWSKVYSLLNPMTRSEHALLLDPARANNVMFGGSDPIGTPLSDTWTYSNGQWQYRSLTTSPPARAGHRMCFDAARNEALLFGGLGSAGHLDDLWAWNGSSWAQRNSAITPSGRQRHGFAFDSRRNVAVLYGGSNNNGVLEDTWEWDGVSWSRKSPTNSLGLCTGPSALPRYGFGMAYEPRAERVVLFGGYVPSVTSTANDLWSWDGQAWLRHNNITSAPSGRSDTQMSYDPTSRKLFIHAGGTGSFAYEDLWEVQLPVFSRWREYGTACVGSRGPLQLSVVQGSLPIIGQTFTMRLSGLSWAFAAGIGFVGFSDQEIDGIPLPIDLAPLGIPGCNAYHSADIDMPIGLPSGNPLTTTWALSIPNDPVFLSIEIYTQALALEGFGYSRFATLSNGIAARIGDR
jgi:hypothetical protein